MYDQKYHIETGGSTGWATLCGRDSSALVNNPEETTCRTCERMYEKLTDEEKDLFAKRF